MRRIARWATTLMLAAAAILIGSDPAQADITFTETAQEEFGVSAQGDMVPDAEGTVRTLREGWERFVQTEEGMRIWEKLDAVPNLEITIDTAAPAELGEGNLQGKVLGTAQVVETDDEGNPTEIVIRIRNLSVLGAGDTLYHELRHAEIWVDNPDSSTQDFHDEVDGYTDAAYEVMRDQLFDLDVVPTSADPAPLGQPSTPIYDAVVSRNTDDYTLVNSALDFGSFLDRISAEPSYTATVIEIEESFTVPELDSFLLAEIDALVDGGVPVDSDGQCLTDGGSLVCGNQPGFNVELGDVMVGMRVGDMIPLDGFDHSLGYFALFDSDGDLTNNWVPQFDHDPYQGTDRWFQMIFEHPTDSWYFRTMEVGEGGLIVGVDPDSNAFGIIEGDISWFVIPRDEIPAAEARVRLAATGLDGDPITAITGLDVNGELSTDPLIGLDGTRIGGAVTGSAGTSDSSVLSYGPTIVPSGGVLDAEFCVTGFDGNPRVGLDVAATLGEPPSSDTATHNSGTTGENGCVSTPLEVSEPIGESSLYFFDGTEVLFVNSIAVLEPASRAPVTGDTGDLSADREMPDITARLYRLYVSDEKYAVSYPGEVSHFMDEEDDVVNPFGRSYDSHDETLATDWNVLWGDWFVVQGPDDPRGLSQGDALVSVEPADGTEYVPQDTGYTFFSTFTMLNEVEAPLRESCNVTVFARHPGLRTTVQVALRGDSDPAEDMNMTWSVWINPEGEMVTTKSVVNPETGVPNFSTEHSTLGAVSGNEIAVMIPAGELEGVEAMRLAAECVPSDAQDIGRYTRDLAADFEIGPGDLEPDIVFETVAVAEDTEESGGQEPVGAAEPADGAEEPVAQAGEPDAPSNAAGMVIIALGIATIGAGAWAYRQAGRRA